MTPDQRQWRVLPDEPVTSLAEYAHLGGGQALQRLTTATPDEVIDELNRAGLRGRGGAGFPTGTKWGSILRGGGRHRYAVCNAAEGEPGTFKDRALIRTNPYQVIEGLVIAARTVDAIEAFVAVKESFALEIQRLSGAISEFAEAGWLDDLAITVVAGPEEYLFGEEKALLEVIEGNDPLPRWLPPYLHGLYATAPQLGWQAHEPEAGHVGEHGTNPTLVNNAETLAQAVWILSHDANAFRSLGSDQSPGTLICTMVGDVIRPGVFEVAMGTPFEGLLELAGGLNPGRKLKAVASGVANGMLSARDAGTRLTHEDMRAAGSGLGSGGFIVYDDSACMVEVAATLSRFLYVESCGQCLPCKLGTGNITEALERIRDGEGSVDDVDLIQDRLRIVADGNRCYLPVQEQNLVSSILGLFPDDFAAHLDGGCVAGNRRIPPPKIVDITDGVVIYDPRQEHKQPDWTYD